VVEHHRKPPPDRKAASPLTAARRALVAGVVVLAAATAATSAEAVDPPPVRATLDALAAEDWETARRAAVRAGAPLPTAVRWWWLLESEPTPDFAVLAAFREARPHWPRAGRLAERTEHAALRADATAVSRHFARFPPRTAYGRWAAARALRALGDDATAAAFARAAWRESSAFTAGDEVVFLREFGAVLGEADHRARLDDLAWRGLEREAARTLPLIDDTGYRTLIEARLWVRSGRYGVDAKVAAVPETYLDDAGLRYERARFRRLRDDAAGARAILLDPPVEAGEPGRWWRERRIAYRGALAEEDYRTAYRLAARHRQVDGLGFADAEWHAGWIALRHLDRPEDALAHFERLWDGVDTPISLARAAYWAGRAARALDLERDAARWFERAAAFGISFYGQEAAFTLGREHLAFARTLPADDPEALAASELGRLARVLATVDDTLILPHVTERLVANASTPGAIGDAIRLAQRAGRWDTAIRGYIPLARAGEVNAAASHPLPSHYAGLLEPAAGVSPALALAVARQESRFLGDAVSPAGARGLMQLLPTTASAVARDAGLPVDTARLTRDPDYNAALGTRYLGGLLARFDDTALAAASYNAGPSRAVRWQTDLGDPRALSREAWLDWLERIPFSETRNYVQRILEGERVYAELLAGS
jgi:soluble lytic murein transglycosylase